MTSYDLTGRRRYSREEKAAIVAEAIKENSVSAVARRHRMAAALLFRWKKELAPAAAAPAASNAPAVTPARFVPARFVPATIGPADATKKAASPRRPASANAARYSSSAAIEIAFPNGCVVTAPAGIGETTLARLIKLLTA
jgi:transposase-like protein